MVTVLGTAEVGVIDDPVEIRRVQSPHGKAFLRLRFEGGTQVDVTLNLAMLIGGIAIGTADRLGYEDKK